nr:uncharacterized protein LOC112734813 [Arachis hypogaea]
MKEGAKASIILGRPFLATAGAIIDVQKGELTLRLHNEKMIFNVFKAMSYPQEPMGECMRLDSLEDIAQDTLEEEEFEGLTEEESASSEEVTAAEVHIQGTLEGKSEGKEAPKLELKTLPPTIKYAYLGENESYPLRSGKTLRNDKEVHKKPAEDDKADSKKEVAIEKKDQEELKKKDEELQASKKGKQVMAESLQEQRKEVKPYTPPLTYPQRLHRELKDQ